MEKKIVLSLACLLIGIGLAIAQTPKTVTGLVIFEEDNQPIVGASVLIKGTNQGAVTDLDGKFTLTNVPGTAKILRITYVGMQTIEVNIKSRLSIFVIPVTTTSSKTSASGFITIFIVPLFIFTSIVCMPT